LTPDKLVFTFGGLKLCVKFGENRQRIATVRVMTHRQTDADRFYYMSHAICYSYGTDKIDQLQRYRPDARQLRREFRTEMDDK